FIVPFHCSLLFMLIFLTLNTFIRLFLYFFVFMYTSISNIYSLSLHDALPIYNRTEHILVSVVYMLGNWYIITIFVMLCRVEHNRSEEHTSELQSRFDLVCRLLLEKKKKI